MAINVAALYEKYGPMVIRRCRKILGNGEDALDAVHDVFVNLLKAESRLNDNFPSSLLYTMATNICLNKIRKWKWESPKELTIEDEGLFSGIDAGYDQVEVKLLLEAVLKEESEMNRSICYMYHADGMTLREIGEVVGLSVAGVHKRLEAFKGRAQFKLRDEGFGEGV
jgi:RNA polymerase sigma-70 factor (ECF subfamily)